MEDPYAGYSVLKRSPWLPPLLPPMRRRSVPNYYQHFRPEAENAAGGYFPDVTSTYNQPPAISDEDDAILGEYLRRIPLSPENYEEILPLIYGRLQYDRQRELEQEAEQAEEEELQARQEAWNEQQGGNFPARFSFSYNTPDKFREGWESRDLVDDDIMTDDIPESRVYFDERDSGGGGINEDIDEYGSGAEEIFRELKNLNLGDTPEKPEIFRELAQIKQAQSGEESEETNKEPSGEESIYTEGGVVYVPDHQLEGKPNITSKLNLTLKSLPFLTDERKAQMKAAFTRTLNELLQNYDMTGGFQRPERLDVKKPGPPFDTPTKFRNQYHTEDSDLDNNIPITMNDLNEDDVDLKQLNLNKDALLKNILLPSMMKKEPRGAHPNPSHEMYYVDTDYVYVTIKDKLTTWRQGDNIIKTISEILSLPPGVLSHGRVDHNEVTFKVNSNEEGMTAQVLANKICKYFLPGL